ncbi:MAG: MBL fold metallo-hydrolase [Tetrasphaera sp.]
MCDCSDGWRAAQTAPHPVEREAVDPIVLAPVDEVRVTSLMENVYDGLLPDGPHVSRAGLNSGHEPAPQFIDGTALVGLRAEHGFSVLVTVRRGNHTATVLFDAGTSPNGIIVNADRLGVDLTAIQGIVLSHGHFDHIGGLAGLAERLPRSGMPLTIHPYAWTPRRLALEGSELRFPVLDKAVLAAEGFEVIERRVPSVIVDGCVLVTGEIDRTTEFELGMPPPHQAWDGADWRHDPLVVDDQALVVNVRDQGLVVITGCGHAGVVNIARHALRLTGQRRLAALIGGFHLGGPAFEPIIAPTVAALQELAPDLIVPGHCTGWRAQHALQAALPDAWVQCSSGSTFRLSA